MSSLDLAGLRPAQRSEAIRTALEADARRLATPRPTGLRCVAAATSEGVCLALPAGVGDVAGGGRARKLAACVAGALALAVGLGVPRADTGDLDLEGASWGGFQALRVPTDDPSGALELLPLTVDDQAAHLDRMEPVVVPVAAGSLDDTEPMELDWLARAELVARLGGFPGAARLDPAVAAALESYGLLLRVFPEGERERAAHDDPSPERRALRRILRRLDGMGKYGGYHTEFSHLARGFPGHERALALEAGEVLLRAGLLAEKPSVGQRHVSLVAARTDEIRKLIVSGAVEDTEIARFVDG